MRDQRFNESQRQKGKSRCPVKTRRHEKSKNGRVERGFEMLQNGFQVTWLPLLSARKVI